MLNNFFRKLVFSEETVQNCYEGSPGELTFEPPCMYVYIYIITTDVNKIVSPKPDFLINFEKYGFFEKNTSEAIFKTVFFKKSYINFCLQTPPK